jgi:hypothetical protein
MDGAMSPLLAVSFLLTLLSVLAAINGPVLQQYLFAGAALAATILICSLEAWSTRELPVRSEDESSLRHRPER